MAEADRIKWDARYRDPEYIMGEGPKPFILEIAPTLPRSGGALDLACGEGQLAVWLAQRGLTVDAVDISPEAIRKLEQLAAAHRVEERVEGIVFDLDGGLPPGLAPSYALVTCVHFRSPERLADAAALLAPGGLLVAEVLTTGNRALGSSCSPAFLAERGELLDVCEELAVAYYREGIVDGRAVAQIVAQRLPAPPLDLSTAR